MGPWSLAGSMTRARLMVCVLLPMLSFQAGWLDEWKQEPRVLASPDGVYQLHVQPSAETGEGPACYRFTRGSELVWSGARPMCFIDAAVLDDGRVVGYAYEQGVHWTVWHGMRFLGLSVAFLDQKGEVQFHELGSEHKAGKINPGSNMSHSDSPRVLGMLVDPSHDRFTLRIAPGSFAIAPSVWWVFRLSTGERIADLVPPHPTPLASVRPEVSAQLVPGTPFTLVHWHVPPYRGVREQEGAALYLLDADLAVVWKKDLPAEYEGLGEEWDWDSAFRIDPPQAQVASKSFSFRSMQAGATLEFSVKEDVEAPSGWRVEVAPAKVTPRGPSAGD